MRLAPSAMDAIIAYRCEIDLSPGSAMAPDTRAAGEMRFCMSAVSFYCTKAAGQSLVTQGFHRVETRRFHGRPDTEKDSPPDGNGHAGDQRRNRHYGGQ